MPTSKVKIHYLGSELELFKYSRNWKKYFSRKLAHYIKGDVLEVGAGIGANTQYLSNNLTSIDSWCFLEPDPNLAAQISNNTDKLKIPKKEIINGIITNIQNKKFDTVIYIDVLEHIEASENEIKEIKKRLKPEGHLIVLVPAYNFLYSSFDKNIGHFRRYNKRILLEEVNLSLTKEKLYYLDSVGFLASLVNKLFLQKELPSKKNVLFWDSYLVRLSMILDNVFFKSFGKSLIGVFKNQ